MRELLASKTQFIEREKERKRERERELFGDEKNLNARHKVYQNRFQIVYIQNHLLLIKINRILPSDCKFCVASKRLWPFEVLVFQVFAFSMCTQSFACQHFFHRQIERQSKHQMKGDNHSIWMIMTVLVERYFFFLRWRKAAIMFWLVVRLNHKWGESVSIKLVEISTRKWNFLPSINRVQWFIGTYIRHTWVTSFASTMEHYLQFSARIPKMKHIPLNCFTEFQWFIRSPSCSESLECKSFRVR